MSDQRTELEAALAKIEEPESLDWNQALYQELGSLSRLLYQKAILLDQWRALIGRKCPHTTTREAVENGYMTTRCVGCGNALHSEPLPGVPLDKD